MACARLTERINLGVSIGFSNGLISVRPKDNQWLILCACVRVGSPINTIFTHTNRVHRCSTRRFIGFDVLFKGRSEKIWRRKYDSYITWITQYILIKNSLRLKQSQCGLKNFPFTFEFFLLVYMNTFGVGRRSVKRNVLCILYGIRRGILYEIVESVDLSILLNSKLCINIIPHWD